MSTRDRGPPTGASVISQDSRGALGSSRSASGTRGAQSGVKTHPLPDAPGPLRAAGSRPRCWGLGVPRARGRMEAKGRLAPVHLLPQPAGTSRPDTSSLREAIWEGIP